MLEDWHRELSGFAAQLKMQRTPPLLVKRSRFDRLWLIISLSGTPGAWAGMGRIVVSSEFLDASETIRRYLLAHELGHIVRRHSQRIMYPWIVAIFCGILMIAAPKLGAALPPLAQLAMYILFYAAGAQMLWAARGFQTEYEADAVAVTLIGKPAVVSGIYEMSAYEGGLTPKRRARLKALGEEIKETDL